MEIVIFAIYTYIYICLHIKLGSIPPFILTYIPLYISPLISIIDFKINFRKFPFVSKIWAHNLPDEPEALKKKQSRKVPWFVVCMYVDMYAPKASKSTLLKKIKIPLTTTLNHFRVFVSWSFCHPKWFGHHLSARDGPTSALIPTKKKRKGGFFIPIGCMKNLLLLMPGRFEKIRWKWLKKDCDLNSFRMSTMPYHLTSKMFINKNDCPKYCLSEQQFHKWKVKRDLAESLYKALSFECLKSRRIIVDWCDPKKGSGLTYLEKINGYFLRTEMDAFLCFHRNTRLSVDLQMLSGFILTCSLKKK